MSAFKSSVRHFKFFNAMYAIYFSIIQLVILFQCISLNLLFYIIRNLGKKYGNFNFDYNDIQSPLIDGPTSYQLLDHLHLIMNFIICLDLCHYCFVCHMKIIHINYMDYYVRTNTRILDHFSESK